jgi:hypothetical protein
MKDYSTKMEIAINIKTTNISKSPKKGEISSKKSKTPLGKKILLVIFLSTMVKA